MDAIIEDQILDLDPQIIVNKMVGRRTDLTKVLQDITGESEANLTLLGADQTEYIQQHVEQLPTGFWVYRDGCGCGNCSNY